MEDIKNLEERTLEEAVQKGKPVKIFFVTGYQVMVLIRDFDSEVIRGTASELIQGSDIIRSEGRERLIYRHAVSAIELS